MYRRAETGISTLIIFITLILVASIAAGVFLTTSGSLRSQSTTTADAARRELATSLQVLKVTGEDGRDNDVEIFCETVRLNHGSDPIKWDETTVLFGSDSFTQNYAMGRRVPGQLIAGGAFQTLPASVFDLDGDGLDDFVRLIPSYILNQNEHIEIRASSNINEFVRLNLGYNLATAGTTPINMAIYGRQYTVTGSSTSNTYHIQLTLIGRATQNARIPASAYLALSSVDNLPSTIGVYSVSEPKNPLSGEQDRLFSGEISEVCFGTTDHGTDEKIHITNLLRYGASNYIEFITPDIMQQEKILLYPYYEG